VTLPHDLFDTVLVLAGVLLVVTGVVMFIRSKTASAASSVEAFGIKLNVTHPSLILVLAGVGLMLAPRLLPDQNGDKPEPAPTAEIRPAATTVAQADATAPEAGTAAPKPEPALAPPVAPAGPTAPSPVSPPKPLPPAIKPVLPVRPPVVKAPPIELPPVAKTPRVVKPRPAAAAKPPAAEHVVKAMPAPAAALPAKPAVVETPATPPVAAKPARPIVAFAALGLPGTRSVWNSETRAGYTQRMHTVVQKAGRDVMRMDARDLELGQKAFDVWWDESRQFPRSGELCAASPAPRALLSVRVETPTTISTVESAFWPEMKLRLFDCARQRIFRQQKTLAPNKDDAWPFEVEFSNEIERFLRSYRDDLAD
jgi:hypothetical protein